MMLASNNGVGQNIGFPDVCLTPPPPPVGPIPIPYPNFGLNVMSAVFSPNIFTGYMPSLNMASIKPMTQGDNSGVLHPLFMQMGGQTMGNPFVFINCIPAKNLLVPTFGNLFNNPIGATLVPSVTTTFYTDREAVKSAGQPVGMEQIRALADALEGEDDVVTSEWLDGRLVVAIRRFVSDVGRRVFNALRGHEEDELVLDLRGNPGGDAAAALSLLDDFTPAGQTLALLVEGEDTIARRGRSPQSYLGEVTILVDGGTASAAEVFAGAMQVLGRARLVGERTAGKGTVQRLCANRDREGYRYQSVAEYRLPDGRRIHGVGLTPDD